MQATLTILLIITMLVDAGMSIYALSRPDRRHSISFAVLTIFLFLYSFGYLLEIQSTTTEAAFVALQMENLAIPFLGFLVFNVVWGQCSAKPLKRWVVILSVLIASGIFFSALFNRCHYLYYTNIDMIAYGDSFFAKLSRGPLYVVQQCFTSCFMLASYVMIAIRFIRGGRKIRRQMYMMALGAMTGFTANILNFSGVLPLGLDLTPLALTLGLLFFCIDIFRHKLLEIVHIATTSAVETMEDAFVVLDMDCHVFFCNQSAKTLFPEMSGFIGMEDITRVSQWPPELSLGRINSGQVVFEHTGPDTDQGRTYRANVSRVSNSGEKQMGWSVAVRDITDIVEAERQLSMENAALDRVNRLKTDLMATISHEMKTPLAVMMGFAELAAAESKDRDMDEQTTADLDAIAAEAGRLARLVEEMQHMALQRNAEAHERSASAEAVIRQIAGLYAPILERRGTRLTIELDEGLPSVACSPHELAQVLFNLINNADRHTMGGEVKINGKLRLDSAVSITVSDTGTGIRPELLSHVFERGISGVEGGTGLGLAICKEIVVSHGGVVEIESEPGQGTSVTFMLHAAKEGMMDG